ncbi:hypothetical protein HispidOSU_017053, partial [Sigmodon hispidus]
ACSQQQDSREGEGRQLLPPQCLKMLQSERSFLTLKLRDGADQKSDPQTTP